MFGSRRPKLLLLALLAVGCESILGLEQTSLSGPDDHRPAGGDGAGNEAGDASGDRASEAAGVGGFSTDAGAAQGGTTQANSGDGGIGASGGMNDGSAVNAEGGVNAGSSAGSGGSMSAGGSTSSRVRPVSGSLVSEDNRCVRAPSPLDVKSARVKLDVCDGSIGEIWRYDDAARLRVVGADGALSAALQAESETVGGAIITASPDDQMDEQRWSFPDIHLVIQGSFCVGVSRGDFSNHMRAQLASCVWDASQAWTLSPTGAFTHANQACLDVYNGYVDEGEIVQSYACNNNANQTFLLQDGLVRFGGKCVGPFGGELKERSPLEIQTCRELGDPERFKQEFHVEGQIEGPGFSTPMPADSASPGTCLDWDEGSAELRLMSCSGRARQRWRWFF